MQLNTVEDVAAAIKAGGWSSGDQYLNELKLMHIELGFEVNLQMNKLLADCKIKRAPEVRLEEIEQLKWMLCCGGPRRTARPALAYAWAVIWMLREIEVSAMERCHFLRNFKAGHHFHPPLQVRPAGIRSETHAAMLHVQKLPEMVLLEGVGRNMESIQRSRARAPGNHLPRC